MLSDTHPYYSDAVEHFYSFISSVYGSSIYWSMVFAVFTDKEVISYHGIGRANRVV